MRNTLTAAATLIAPAPAYHTDACVMTLPEPPSSSIEYEIETEYEGYDSSTDRVRYKVEIEVEGLGTSTPMQCQCALGLGSTATTAPASFEVTGAIVGIRGTGDEDLDAFDGFSNDSAVESFVSGLPDFPEGATPFGFSVDVSPFTIPDLNPGEILALIFEIQFDPDDFDDVNGNAITFAAGSNAPDHEVVIFSGYRPTLALPSFGAIPEPASTSLIAAMGAAALHSTRRRV